MKKIWNEAKRLKAKNPRIPFILIFLRILSMNKRAIHNLLTAIYLLMFPLVVLGELGCIVALIECVTVWNVVIAVIFTTLTVLFMIEFVRFLANYNK